MGEIFISHAAADAEVAGRIADDLRLADYNIFLDSDQEDGIAPGAAWQRALFRKLRTCDAVLFLNSIAAQASMWCHSELVVAAELGKRVYSLDLVPDLAVHPLLRSLQSIRFDTAVSNGVRRLTKRLELDGLAGSSRLRWESDRPPYPGLVAMDVADAGVFFGRDDDIRDLAARVDGPLGQRDGDLVVVMGPSGAGKSSLVRAGLAARLSRPRSGWAVAAPFEPGIRPLDRLAERLDALLPSQLASGGCRDRLAGEGLAVFGEWLVGRASAGTRRLLIVVDQAEQLSTVTGPGERGEFLSVLGGGFRPGSPVTVVMTVRSDRFDEIQQFPEIGDTVRAPVAVAPLNRSRLELVIEGPARRADLSFEPGLVSRLANDAARGGAETADALPLLAFVLREMYERMTEEDRTILTAADYERTGQIDGAIARRAKAAEDELKPRSEEAALDRLLARFLALDGERRPAARPVPRELLSDAEKAVARKLEDQRLLAGTADTVRLAHERLLTAWPRLDTMVTDHRDDLLIQARLERQAADWQGGHGALLGPGVVEEASSWLARDVEFGTSSPAVADYVRKSQTTVRRRKTAAKALRLVLTALSIFALASAVFAFWQRDSAVGRENLAQSEAMAAEAANLLPRNGLLAMLVSLQAYRRAPSFQARSAVMEAAQQPLKDQLDPGGSDYAIAFSRDGRTLVTLGDDDGPSITFWDAATWRRTGRLPVSGAVTSVVLSPDGHTLAAVDFEDGISLWDLRTHRQTVKVGGGAAAAFSPDGRTLAVSSLDGRNHGGISLWDVATGERTATFTVSGMIPSISFSPDGRTLAAGENSGDVGLWDVATGRKTATFTGSGPADTVAFSPDGRILAVGTTSGDVGLWNVATGRKTAILADDGAESVAFSPDGRILAAGGINGDVGLWDVATGRKTATFPAGGPVGGVAFSPDGHTLAAADLGLDSRGDFGSYGGISLLDVAPARLADATEGSPAGAISFSPDGRFLAVTVARSYVGLWDPVTGRREVTFADDQAGQFLFSPDKRTLAIVDENDTIGLWDVATRRKTGTIAGNNNISGVAFSPDGSTLAVGETRGVKLVTVKNGRATRAMHLRVDGDADSVAFSPDGRTLAITTYNGVELLDVESGHVIGALPVDAGATLVAFSPDGRILAARQEDNNVGLWDVGTRKKTATLADGTSVSSMAFSPGTEYLVTADDLGNLSIWDLADGQRLASLPEGGNGYHGYTSLAFSPSGSILAIGGVNGDITLLRLDFTNLTPQYFTNLICGKVHGNMTRTEWADYISGQPYQQTCP